MHDNLAYRFFKRALDLGISLVVVVLLFWLFVAIWIVVRLDSPGPGLFKQKRVGRYGHPFTCYKFRTMAVATPELGTHEVSQVAITRAGGVLRRTKLDELPQLFNVIFNHMSLVGPRPCLLTQTELIDARRALSVLDIKPGITGLAQINDVDMSDPQRLARWDKRYMEERSTIGDLKILVATATGRGAGDRTAL